MTEEQKIKAKRFNLILAIIGGVSSICVILSPFIGIWYDFNLSWKIFLSGVIGVLTFKFIDKVFKDVLKDLDK